MQKNKEVKGVVIKYKGRNIIVTKDAMQTISGGLLVLLSLILSGLFAFVSVGFDPSKLLTGGFWVSYCITTATVWLCFFGVYVIRESRNKRQPKIVINNQKRRDFRETIVENRKIDSCENWLKIYNYERKVSIFRDSLLEAYRKLDLTEPDKSLNKDSKKYQKQVRCYTKNKEKRDYLQKQLDYTNIHNDIVKKLRVNDLAGAEELKKKLGDDDAFKCAKITWRNVYFNDLFNGSMSHSNNTIFYNKSKAIFDNIKLMLVLGVCMTLITTSIILQSNELSLYTIISIITNLAMLCGYAVSAIRVADNVVFEVMYSADENKLTICNLFKEDDEKVGEKWVNIDKLDKENEETNRQDLEGVENEKDDT